MMPKKASSKKVPALGGGSSSVQIQVATAAAVKPPTRRLGAFDLRSPSYKFEQTLELQASASTEETIQWICAGKVSTEVELDRIKDE
ncbi:hypothetical protein GUJ93_ZPchr0003g17369 [Zizania palustris]|uniref:Uncharacterized protein n=1 Tax=Zizania palustris TaxID=103762 RepID=A0A8J5RWY0_ZIZPA|nr:hypothetical protein GUJ93_ZPchr0003g17369 [Zizania palustris]